MLDRSTPGTQQRTVARLRVPERPVASQADRLRLTVANYAARRGPVTFGGSGRSPAERPLRTSRKARRHHARIRPLLSQPSSYRSADRAPRGVPYRRVAGVAERHIQDAATGVTDHPERHRQRGARRKWGSWAQQGPERPEVVF